MYNELVGGALALTKEQFMRGNGWSNLYWGWGVSEASLRRNRSIILSLSSLA